MVSDCSRYRECKMQHMPEFMAWCCYCCSMPAQLLVSLLVLHASVGFSESLGSDPSFFLSNGCFSEWLRRSSSNSRDKSQSAACPQCRTAVQSVGRNHFLHNIEEARYLLLMTLFINMFLKLLWTARFICFYAFCRLYCKLFPHYRGLMRRLHC